MKQKPMRKPTTINEQYRWHAEAIVKLQPPIHADDPQCGWYRTKLTKGGVWVPAQIWLEQDIDPLTGQLANDERFYCVINGQHKDAYEHWHWLAAEPITEDEYEFLTKSRAWSAKYEPDSPEGDPDHTVDWFTSSLPDFNKEPEND